MKLYGTAPSPFTRKVRIILREIGIPCELVRLTNLLEAGSQNFAENPLQKFPVLEDGGERLIDSDIICEYLVENYGKNSPFGPFWPEEKGYFADKKRLEIINGTMDAGVVIIRATRSKIADLDNYPMFRQERAAVQEGLHWLNQDLRLESFYPGRFTYLDVALICLCDWIVFRGLVPNLNDYPNLARFSVAHRNRPSVNETVPANEAAYA